MVRSPEDCPDASATVAGPHASDQPPAAQPTDRAEAEVVVEDPATPLLEQDRPKSARLSFRSRVPPFGAVEDSLSRDRPKSARLASRGHVSHFSAVDEELGRDRPHSARRSSLGYVSPFAAGDEKLGRDRPTSARLRTRDHASPFAAVDEELGMGAGGLGQGLGMQEQQLLGGKAPPLQAASAGQRQEKLERSWGGSRSLPLMK